ncbi:hypothetical protein [Actinomadura litoris]|uniref:hypothetical protein n=1 Tax=Actinomadura litoris TaxID=2678616 RepID=UPI001FA7BF6F|nr:hypothetical protein [Actinomadura litoris]
MFEQPPCPDGHGEECPERACTECGTAMLVGAVAAPGPPPSIDHAQPARDRSAHTRPSRAGSTRAVA